jgi:hypothetical protein
MGAWGTHPFGGYPIFIARSTIKSFKTIGKSRAKGDDMLKTGQKRGDYALHRMSLTIDRILGNGSKEEKAQTIKWMGAWQARHAAFLAEQKLDELRLGR